MEINLKQLEID